MYLTRKQCVAIRELNVLALTNVVGDLAQSSEVRARIAAGDAFAVDTEAGTLRLVITTDLDITPRKWSPGFVHGRFDEPERAARLTDCNPYSGKWNFHNDTDVDVAQMQGILRKLRPVNFRMLDT